MNYIGIDHHKQYSHMTESPDKDRQEGFQDPGSFTEIRFNPRGVLPG